MGNYANNNQSNGLLKGLRLILPAITVFGYLLYFTGRTYSEAYYSTIGIPSGILNFDFWDYVYSGARGLNIILPVIFTAIFVGFLYRYLPEKQIYFPSARLRDVICPWFLSVYYAVWLVLFGIAGWYSPAFKAEFPYIFMSLATCILFSLSIPVLWDKATVARIKEGRFLNWLFSVAIALGLIFFPYTSADSWGRFEGVRASDNHPLVQLYAPNQVIDDIQWEVTSTGSFRTVDGLRLIFSNEQYLILESGMDKCSLYVIPTDDILSIKVIHPER